MPLGLLVDHFFPKRQVYPRAAPVQEQLKADTAHGAPRFTLGVRGARMG
jgi:energy-converting hydrogenase Eha subunit F